MKKLSGAEIRRMWLDFFASKGHYIEPGAGLIPHNDPTLLWINSGVAALKKYFDGSEASPHNRITNAQKSIRTNDIDNVGRTARHHTFFEMLGNFSIGDYFREEAITWGFELLTSPAYFAIPKEKLYITYHPSDIATRDLWIKLGMDPSHLVPLEHNFWEIGEGPCGPNTEMFYDRGEKYDPEGLGERMMFEDIDNDRYIEIWNIVFSQYNAEAGVERAKYKELPRKNIDTGAGLERLACVFQDTETNFETDLFYPYIQEVEKYASYKYEGNYKMAYRVIADHIRTCTFALSDGASFSNEGRGYVLRRILRRAVRYLRNLGINKPFLHTLVPLVAKNMEDYYPYLQEKAERVSKMIYAEEVKFASTLQSGESLLNKMVEKLEGNVLSGSDAFKLYDTYGFPLELTEEILSEKGITLDKEGFKKEMNAQKERARASRGDFESMNAQAIDLMECKEESFFTYDPQEITSKVVALFKNGVKVDSIDDEGEIMFDKTNFYATSGGQINDIGSIINSSSEAEVNNVIKAPNKQHLHFVKVKYGEIKIGDEFRLLIDENRRRKIQKNHSGAHLLQKALQVVLGDDIHQEGSFVSDEYLRFDFNYQGKLSFDQLSAIETEVNRYIASEIESNIEIMSLEEAKKVGAMALFSEKYGEVVRVVSFGDVSKEFCGGTHVENTSALGVFTIVSEGAIASGIRRIEAKTSYAAYNVLKNKDNLLNKLATVTKVNNINDIEHRINTMNDEIANMKKKLNDTTNELAALKAKNLKDSFIDINGMKVLVSKVPSMERGMFNSLFDSLKVAYDNSIVLLALVNDDKISFICGVSASLQDKFNAGLLIRKVASLTSGSGGGRKDVAQGGGKDVSKLDSALNEILKDIHSC